MTEKKNDPDWLSRVKAAYERTSGYREVRKRLAKKWREEEVPKLYGNSEVKQDEAS